MTTNSKTLEGEVETVITELRDIDPQQRMKEAVGVKASRFKREWEERYSALLVGRKHWKMVAAAQTVVIAGLCFALWDLGRRAHTQLYVLERNGNQIGYAGPVQPQNMDDATWDLVRVEQLKKFISAWRTVTSDAAAQNVDWDTAFAFVGDNSQARSVLAQWYETNDPLKRAAKNELVTVQFKTFDPPVKGSHTYGIWWSETTTSSSGQVRETKEWHARIVYTQRIPTQDFARAANGLGILAMELSFEPVQAGEK